MFSNSINLINKTGLFTLLISLFPLSFIGGNLLINLNILILVLSCLLICRREICTFKLVKIDKWLVLIFLYILFVGSYNTIENLFFYNDKPIDDFTIIKKTFLYLRYLLLYLIVRFLIEKKLINLQLFFLSALISSLFVSLDLIYQFTSGSDIFGFEKIGRKYSGPFGDEAIAGGFLQRYSILGIFYIFLFLKLSNNKKIVFGLVLFTTFLIGILISGNRMPFILFFFSIFLFFIFEKRFRKFFILIILITSITTFYLVKYNQEVKNNFSNLLQQLTWSYDYLNLTKKERETKTLSPQYLYEFSTAYGTWRLNKYIGGGMKSFRVNCIKRENVIERWREWSCNIHPHNYYLEILTDFGIFGFFIFVFFIIRLIYLSLFKTNFLILSSKLNVTLTPLIIVLISELFPIRSSGSFFTTNNSAFIFLLFAIIVSISKKKNLD
jgi:O-antigen ligase